MIEPRIRRAAAGHPSRESPATRSLKQRFPPFRQLSGRDYVASVLSQSFKTTCDARMEQDTGEVREEYSLTPLLSKQGAAATRHTEHVSCHAVLPAFLPVCRRRLRMRLTQLAAFTSGRSSAGGRDERSKLARPYIGCLIVFGRSSCPSVCPLFHSRESAATTASPSRRSPAAKLSNSATLCGSQPRRAGRPVPPHTSPSPSG